MKGKKRWIFVMLVVLIFSFCSKGFSLVFEKCLSGNCQDGYGKARFSRGSTYEGQWKNGAMEGDGVYLYEKGNSGKKYKGEFKKGHFEGEGKFWSVDGSRFVGEWKRGQQVKGTFYYKNGKVRKCTGEWKGPYLHGKGACWYKNGKKKEGFWKKGKYKGKSY